MRVFVLEGSNDVIFIKSILNRYFSENSIPTAYDRNLKKGIKVLIRKLRNSGEYLYLRDKFGFILYGDNGKYNIISKVLPRLCCDLFGKNPPKQAELLVILDSDDGDGTTLIDILTEIKNKNIPDSRIVNVNRNCFKIQNQSDSSYWIFVKLHLIPKSLERQIVNKGITILSNINKRKKEELLNCDPHRALDELASLQNTSKESLIKQSVFEGWFLNEEWYISLINEIDNFLDC